MKLDPMERVSLHDAEQRALNFLGWTHLTSASMVADHIWIGHKMKAQGAGAAAARILVGLKKRGLVEWRAGKRNWGWRRTRHE